MSHCIAQWLVHVFHLVVVVALRYVGLPLYCNSPLADHFFLWLVTAVWLPKALCFFSELWLDCLFMLFGFCVTLPGAALLLLSISICLMLRLIFSLISFRHDVLTYVRIVSSAFCSLLGVWPRASAESGLCCCIGVTSLMVGIYLGLCVAGLLTFRQPQQSMEVPLVYNVDGAYPGISETGESFCFFPLAWIVLHAHVDFCSIGSAHCLWSHLYWNLSTVSGHEALSLWPKTSPLNSLCWLCFALSYCAGLSVWAVMVLCCSRPACWTVLQWLVCCWHLLHYWSITLLATFKWDSRWRPLLRPWIGFSLQFRTWLLVASGRLCRVFFCTYSMGFLYKTLLFWILYFPLGWDSFVRAVVLAISL